MKKIKVLFIISLTALFFMGCKTSTYENQKISGVLDYVGDASATIHPSPLHYKYSPKKEYKLNIDSNGNFKFSAESNNSEFYTFSLDDKSFLLINDPSDDLRLKISRSDFPLNIEIQSRHQTDYQAYQTYLTEIDGLDRLIELEMNKFRDGKPNQAISLTKKKIELATANLTGTKFQFLIDKAKGEYVVNRVKSVMYRFNNPGFNADSVRKEVMTEAKNNNFFTLESLKAQRAGIRDVTHYYARTFGIYDSVQQALDLKLAEYDLKRVAYEELNKRRLEVIDYIEDQEAQAYARMFLVAERIGEIELSIASESYKSYLEEFSEFTEYTDFLTYLYNEIKSVSPGEPAISFTLPDKNGNLISMSDFKGKYVLLDFWAGWCQPCLDEFPIMRDIYTDFDRDDFEIISISTEIDKEVWEKDIERFPNPWFQLYGGNGFDQETFKEYKGGGIPFYILIDPDGNIARYNDIRASFNLRDVITNLIDEK